MEVLNLIPAPGSKKRRKRVGRGHGSGNGKTAGKGHKGQKARSGGAIRWGFEGGQMPLQRRIPKRGFNNIFAKKVVAVRIEKLNFFDEGSIVTVPDLFTAGIIKKKCDKVKIIGDGGLAKKISVKANGFSENVKKIIERSGGTWEVV